MHNTEANPTSESDWINNAQRKAEEIRIARNQKMNGFFGEEKKKNNNEKQEESCEWKRAAKHYLTMCQKRKEKSMDPYAAAKFAERKANAENKLVTAIELGRNGYMICSLWAILSILKQDNLSRDDRLNACTLTIESIAACEKNISNQTKEAMNEKDWKHLIRNYRLIAKVAETIVQLQQNNDELEKLTERINDIINMAATNTSTNFQILEKKSLEFCRQRSKTKEDISRMHQRPVIRSIHHLACTGGTVMCKCIASMPDVALISEVNPMNRVGDIFAPNNPLLALEKSYRDFSTEERIDIFKMEIKNALEICIKDDVDLILRDHSHTDFHTGNKESDTCAIHDHLSNEYDLISIVTVRHPLDSYLSLVNQGWDKQFSPNSFDEYCRRYLKFMEKYKSLKIIRYEDFCKNPETIMVKLCETLRITYDEEFTKKYGSTKLSGDSGRSGTSGIEQRPRRETPDGLKTQIEESEYYFQLTKYLNYPA